MRAAALGSRRAAAMAAPMSTTAEPKGVVMRGVPVKDAPFFPLLPAEQLTSDVPRVNVPILTAWGVQLVGCSLSDAVAGLAAKLDGALEVAPGTARVVFSDDGSRVPSALTIADLLPHSWAVQADGVVVCKFAPARSARGAAASRTLPALTLALGPGGAKGADESALLDSLRRRLRDVRGDADDGRRAVRFPEFVQLVREAMQTGGFADAHGTAMQSDPEADTADSDLMGGVASARGPRDARLRGSERGLLRVARALASELEREGEVVRVRHSADSAVRDTLVLLRPEDSVGMTSALDVDGSQVRAAIEEKVAELARLLERLEVMDGKGRDIGRRARRQARWMATGAGVLMVGQYGVIFHQIYSVSWDVMEPLCYFLAQTYAVIAYAYFLATRAEPDNAGIFGWLVQRRRSAMHAALPNRHWRDVTKFDSQRSELVGRIATLRDEVSVLLARLGFSPDSRDLGAASLAAPIAAAALEARASRQADGRVAGDSAPAAEPRA